MVGREAAGLFLAPGLGKTRATLEAFAKLKKAGEVDKLLIFAKLKICYLVWPKEIKKWGFNFSHTVVHGHNKNKLFDQDTDIHLINYEATKWLMPKLVGKDRHKYDMCVLDESSKIKNFGAPRSKRLHKAAHFFNRRYILTGSPIPKYLLDIFSQILFLDFGERLGKYFTHFRNEYFYPSGYMGYKWLPFKDSHEVITKKLKDIILRISAEEAGIELPKINSVIRRVELTGEALKTYKAMEADYVADIKSGVITAATAAVANNKLRQIANGGIYDENKKEHVIHDEKTEELQEIVDELGGSPCLVCYEFGHDLHRLRKAFPKASWIGGGVKEKDAEKIEAAWNRGEVEVLFGQPGAIAYGLNLQDGGCYTIVIYGIPNNLEDYEQFILRVARQGNKSKFVNVLHLVASNTTDEDIMMNLHNKDETQQTFLNSLEERLNVKLIHKRGVKMKPLAILAKHIPKPIGPCFYKSEKNEDFIKMIGSETYIHNFVHGFKDVMAAWLPKQHITFLKDMGVKKIRDDVKLGDLYGKSNLLIQEILGASVSEQGFFVLKDVEIINQVMKTYKGYKPMVKESRIAEETENDDAIESTVEKPTRKKRSPKAEAAHTRVKAHVKSRNKKAATKKKAVATTKKSTAKSSAKPTKKQAAKKPAGRKPKTELTYKASSAVKVTSDEFPRAQFRCDVLKAVRRIRTKKLGYIVTTVAVKLSVSELRVYQALEGLRDKGYINFK